MNDNLYCSRNSSNCLTGCNGEIRPGLGGLKADYLKPCCIQAIKEVCYYLIDLFAENNIKYWLDFGTLLGAARNGEIIPWDKDADVGILKNEEKKLLSLESKINKDGFYFVKKPKQGFYRINYSKTNFNFVDIFTWNLFTNNNSNLSPQTTNTHIQKNMKFGFVHGNDINSTNKSFPYYFIENTVPLKFYDKFAQVPQDYEKFLELRFGKHWKIPQRGWTRGNKLSQHKIENWCVKERNWKFKE